MKMIVTLTTTGLLLWVAGCQSSHSHRAGIDDDSRAAVCSQCKTVWVERPDMNDPYMMTTVAEEIMTCPDCESAVAHFFRTGELAHYCDSCRGTLWYCEGQ